jgi:hypothetical protein
MERRSFLGSLAAVFGGALALGLGRETEAGPRARAVRRHRRRVRRRIRRRIRRRVGLRVWLGRPFWVVPVGVAVGWELVHKDRVVVVQSTKVVVRDDKKIDVLVVRDHDGKTEEVEVLREDTAENKAELEGSQLPDGDQTTPGRETEIEEEVDDDK